MAETQEQVVEALTQGNGGVTEPPGPTRPDGRAAPGRDPASGRFLAGNGAAVSHGLTRPEALDVVARCELRDAVLVDLGGVAECSAVLRVLVEDLAQAVVLRDTAFDYLARVGPLTKAGRQRAVVGLYLAASARVERLAAQIGTSRRAKPVPSLRDILAARASESAS